MTTPLFYAPHVSALENGSFIKAKLVRGKMELARFINGDFMGYDDSIPADWKCFDKKTAFQYIPKSIR